MRTFWIIALVSVIGSILISIFFPNNITGAMGWIVALCWFPYEELRKIKKKGSAE